MYFLICRLLKGWSDCLFLQGIYLKMYEKKRNFSELWGSFASVLLRNGFNVDSAKVFVILPTKLIEL